MAKVIWKPGTMLSPLPPALVSCGTVEDPKVLTIAWTGIVSSEPVMTYVSIRPMRHSHDIIKKSGEFVINLPTLDMLVATDYCGMKSGKDVDKFKEMGLTPLKCSKVKAPQIAESPVSLECKVVSVTNHGSHDMFLAEVLAVNVDDKYMDKSGHFSLEKAGLLAFSHGKYFTLGRMLGTMGFSVNKAKLKEVERMKDIEISKRQGKMGTAAAKPAVKTKKPAPKSKAKSKKKK